MKTIKFREHLVKKVLNGEKTSTWRLFDDKNLASGDEVELINWNTGKSFAEAVLTEVREKKLGEVFNSNEGHEKYESKEKMYEEFKKYYGDKVNSETVVKIIKFRLK